METIDIKLKLDELEFQRINLAHCIGVRESEIRRFQAEIAKIEQEQFKLKKLAQMREFLGCHELLRLCQTPCYRYRPAEISVEQIR